MKRAEVHVNIIVNIIINIIINIIDHQTPAPDTPTSCTPGLEPSCFPRMMHLLSRLSSLSVLLLRITCTPCTAFGYKRTMNCRRRYSLAYMQPDALPRVYRSEKKREKGKEKKGYICLFRNSGNLCTSTCLQGHRPT